MSSTESFLAVLDRLNAGDDRGARELVQRFSERLIAFAKTRLSNRLREKLDPEDVLQSVFRSFFTRIQDGQFQLDSWDNLWSVLTVMTVRKCSSQGEYYLSAKRDVNREVPWCQTLDETLGTGALAREPSPAEVAALADTLECLFTRLSERDGDVLSLHLQGYRAAEIGIRVGIAVRTVKRSLARIRQHLRDLDSGLALDQTRY